MESILCKVIQVICSTTLLHGPEHRIVVDEKLQEEPLRDLKLLAEKVVDACHGLCLALEVLGAYLRGKDISEWEVFVKVLKARNHMVNSQKEVTAILKTTSEALCSIEEKEMFLDIACFLFQVLKKKAPRMWRSDYGDAAAELYHESLCRKCLVKIDKNGGLSMHDMLCDMGWEVFNNSHKDYWEYRDTCGGRRMFITYLKIGKGVPSKISMNDDYGSFMESLLPIVDGGSLLSPTMILKGRIVTAFP